MRSSEYILWWVVTLILTTPATMLTQQQGEGPSVTGSAAYRAAGDAGQGIKIGIFDNGFDSILIAQANGDAPTTFADTVDIGGNAIFAPGNTHGTRVCEAIFDHAPGATYSLYKMASSSTLLSKAVDAAISHGVNIISMSLTFFNQGWVDNSGTACSAVKKAADAGILVFVAAGNQGVQHWSGYFKDNNDNDSWHEWSGADEYNAINVSAGNTVFLYLQWDTQSGNFNYDLYLYNATGDTLRDSSKQSGNNFESINWAANSTQTVKVRVKRVSGVGTDSIQLFARGFAGISAPIQYFTTSGSVTSPSNSTEPNVLSVGAVNWSFFDTANGTSGIIKSYSSQGPTNSGYTKPDLCGPTDVTTFVGPAQPFGGTSAATPNAAGTAAAFWSSASSLSSAGVRYLLLEMAEIFKDWGQIGQDNIYGRGGIYLYEHHINTRWVDPRAGNNADSDTLPYYHLSAAHAAASSGGRIVFLGGNYPEPIVLNKKLVFESIRSPAIVGQP